MTATPLVLGLDIGTSRMKALLLDRSGRSEATAWVGTPFGRSDAGTELTVEALQARLAELLHQLGPGRARVAGVGVAGVAESGAPLDRTGRPLAPVIAWHDPRGTETVARLQHTFGGDLSRRIGQTLRPVSSVAKLGWLVDHGVTGVSRWLGVPELCLFLLSGAEATEHSLAARTGCYDVERRCYLPDVAEAAGFPVDVFAPVLGAGAVAGRVSAAGSAWSGLPAGVAVTLAGHDHLAGVDGCGAGDDDLVNSVGTAETVIARHAGLPDIDRALELRAAVTVRPGGHGWATLTSAARAGIVLDRVAEALGESPPDLDRSAEGSDAVQVPGLVERAQQGEDLDLPDAPPGAVWRGLLQALADRTHDAVRRSTAVAGACASRSVGPLGPWDRVVVVGGGSASRPSLAAKAAVLPLPVWRSGVAEAVSRGAALRGGMAAGWWPAPADAPPAPLEPVAEAT